MLTYSESYFDDMPDNILKGLNVLAQIAKALEEADVAILQKSIDGMSLFTPDELLHFLQQVNAAMERRFGPVPGY